MNVGEPERTSVESAWSESEENAFVSQAPIGMAQIGLDGALLRMNNRYCQMLGYSEAELRIKTLQDLTHPDDWNAALRGRDQLLEGEISCHTMEKRFIRKDGTIYWGRLNRSLMRDRDGVARCIIAVVEDITEKIQAESALRDSEQRLMLAQSAAHLGVWDCNLRLNLTVISEGHARMHGLAPDHPPLTQEEWLGLVHPADRERVQAFLRESIEQTHVWEHEFRVVWPDGSVHWLLGKGEVFLDESRRPVRMAGVSLDITERKRAEEQRSHLAAIVESSDIAIIGENVDGTIVSWNRGAEELYGYKAEQMVGRDKSPMIPPDRLDQARLAREALGRGERLPGFETRGVRKDGRQVPISMTLSPIIDSAGAVVGISAIARDITARKQAEAALRESEERFRSMADAAPVMIWVADADANCIFMSKSWLTFTGRTLEQEMGHGWTASIHPDDLDRCSAIFSTAFNARRNFEIEYRARRADGEYRWVLGSGVPRFGSDGRFEGYIGSSIDITDSKRAHEEALGKQKLESIGVLAGGIAHDFNNLLAGILAQTESIEQDLPGGSSHIEELRRIKEAAIRGSEIVRELMIYSGQDKAEPDEPVDLSRLVEEMLKLLKISISKHAVLKADLPKDLPAVRGDAPQLRQIVMNLVINASEAIGDKDGVIRVTLSRTPPDQDLISNGAANLPEGGYLRLEVSDTGSGITEETKARIFDPFFTTRVTGRGLGLAVVQGIVRDHRGAINVISTPGQGTTFQIDLPCVGEPAKPDRSAAVFSSDERISSPTGTVLLVEDEDTLRHSVSKMLRKHGFSVIEAGNGSAAIDLVRSYKDSVEVILLDLTIPGAQSSEVVAEALRIRPGVRVVLMSAYSRGMAPPSLNTPEVKGFIRKPFQMSDLVQLLRDTISAD